MTTALNYGLIAALFLAWIGLFAVKDASRSASQEIVRLEQDIAETQERLGVLATDWAILNEPGYLQALAQTYLGLETLAPQQIVTMSALPGVPLHADPSAARSQMVAARGYRQYTSPAAPARAETDAANVAPTGDWVMPLPRPDREG